MTIKKLFVKSVAVAAIAAGMLVPAMTTAQEGPVMLKATQMAGKIEPKAVDAASWKTVPAREIALDTAPSVHDAISGEAAVKRIKVQVARTEDGVFFRLQWKDKTAETKIQKLDGFLDGVAIQFAVDRDRATSPIMGGEDKLVNIWYWSAATNKGHNLGANGFGTLTPLATQDVTATGKYRNGTWTVIFYRPVKSTETQAVKFEGTGEWPVSFAVWDGANMERDGLKAVNVEWQTLSF